MNERINVSPTLIIGLGGTGTLAVQYAKQKIRKRLESYEGASLPPQIPFLEYLVIDTTTQEEIIENLIDDEIQNIGRINISRIIANLELESDNKILQWFPKRLDPGQIDSGAGGVRAIGRLCLFVHESEIEGRIRNKVKQITSSAHIKNFLGEHLSHLRIDEASTINVHLVTSLCGGTGSACLLDIAYLVKHIIEDITKQMPNSVAHLVTPEPFEGEPGVGRSSREYIQYNFAVALSEIEHFTMKDAPKPWDVEYRNSTRVYSKEKPFSLAYLLGYKEGVSLSKKQLCEIIGETIAINTVHRDGKLIKSLIENYKPHVINTEDAGQKRRTYSSYNTQILNIGVDDNLFRKAVSSGAKKILASLCEAAPPATGELAYGAFEHDIIAAALEISSFTFAEIRDQLKNAVDITPDRFWGAYDAIRDDLQLPKKKRDKELPDLLARVNDNSMLAEAEIEVKQREFVMFLRAAFKTLGAKTDEHINSLLDKQSLPYVYVLLKHVSHLVAEFQNELTGYKKSLPSREQNYDEEIVKTIKSGNGEIVQDICFKRAQSRNHGPIVETLVQLAENYKRQIDERATWCKAAYECLLEVNEKLPEDKVVTRSSHTTSFVWNEAALNLTLEDAKGRVLRRFISLLEQKYYSDAISQKVYFLLCLDKQSLPARTIAKELAEEATRLQLQEEIVHNEGMMRKRALDSIHEFVELASPAWQIERNGDDIATVAITNCPEGSESGQIMSRYGKNISFSQNDDGSRELILFRSEHGVSVNQLINFRNCLNAVSRKLYLDGKERINDLCLDPNWEIAAPLPLKLDDLRRDFSLAIHLGLIKPGFAAYTFVNSAGTDVLLRQNKDKNKATKRFEAFGRLLELDCDGSQDCHYLKERLAENRSTNLQETNIVSFREQLLKYQQDLRKKISNEKDVREEMQLEKEIAGVSELVEQIEKSIEDAALDDNAPST